MKSILNPLARIIHRLVGHSSYEKLRYIYYQKFVPHAGYDRSYYDACVESNSAAYDLFAKTLAAEFHPSCLVDVGCGSGGISSAFMQYGCKSVMAFDRSTASVEIARTRGIASVQQLDLIEAKEIPAKGDLCICCEVAEHIPEKNSAHLCELLSKPAPILAFTAAHPGQIGHLHVNCKPQSWWIDLMRQHGMIYDPEAVLRIRERYNGKMSRDYDTNLMIFRRNQS